MRALIGFILLHAGLIGVGLCALRALGLIGPARGSRLGWASAFGPAFLIGTALVVPCLIVGLVVGVNLTLWFAGLVMIAWVLVSRFVAVRGLGQASAAPGDRGHPPAGGGPLTAAGTRAARCWRAFLLAAGAYALLGMLALATAPTRGDDARIWSLKGLTLAYYGQLKPEIFLNPMQAGEHPVYPLFAPVTEAVLSKAMGHPELRLYHVELWLLFAAALWTAGLLLLSNANLAAARVRVLSVAPLAALALVPVVVNNLVIGDVDVIGSVLLAVGTLAFALWIDGDRDGCLALAAILLAAAGNIKDEDMLAAVCVVALGSLAALARRRSEKTTRHRGIALLGLVAYFVLVVAPWRVWTAVHHLTDSVQPSLPHALDPLYLVDRTHQFKETAAAMLTQVLGNWDWVGAVFLVACLACLTTRTVRRAAAFYLASFGVIVVALLWLYTTTPVSLSFLLPTSMSRTVGVFMTLALVGSAHLVSRLAGARGRAQGDVRACARGGVRGGDERGAEARTPNPRTPNH